MGEVFIGARILTGQTSMTFDKQEYQRKWYERNKSMHIARTLSRYTAQRVHLLALLGSECACCGEAETLFLDIDHINGVSEEEKRLGGKKKRYSWAKLFKYVPMHLDEFQILCSNCNQGKRRNGGVCPHQR